MARYIDADALTERLQDFSKWCRDGRKQGVDFVLDCPLPDMPTADVVPKREVERLNKKIDALKRDRYQVLPDGRLELLPRTDLYKIKAEVAREIFEEIDRIIDEKYNRFVFKDQPYDSDEEIDAIINYSDSVSDAITELKKKYTEEG